MIRKKFLIELILLVFIACIFTGMGIINKSERKSSTLSQEMEELNRKVVILHERLNQKRGEIARLKQELSKEKEERLIASEKLANLESDLSVLGEYLIKAREEGRSYKEKITSYEDKLDEEARKKKNLERLLEIQKTLEGMKEEGAAVEGGAGKHE